MASWQVGFTNSKRDLKAKAKSVNSKRELKASSHMSQCMQTINPSETFGDILIDYSYVELSSTCTEALHEFSSRFPKHRSEEVQTAMARGKKYILGQQRADGSWYGSWGVCFTYAAWFG